MKVLLEICIIILLIWVGWRQPYREHLQRALGMPELAGKPLHPALGGKPTPTPLRLNPATPPARDSAWMWRHSTLDH